METQEIKNIKSVMDHTNLKRKSIGSLGDRFKSLKPKPKSKITNERQLVLKEFLDILNPPRIKDGFPLLKPMRLGIIFEGVSTSDVKVFLANCNDASNFSKYFWWRTNLKKQEENKLKNPKEDN